MVFSLVVEATVARAGPSRLIDIRLGQEVASRGCPRSRNFGEEAHRQFALDAEAELLGIGDLEIRIHGLNGAPHRGADAAATGNVREVAALVISRGSDIGRIVQVYKVGLPCMRS